MPTFLLSFFAKPANIIGSILVVIILGLLAYTMILKHEVSNRDEIIAQDKVNLITLKNNVTTLQSSITEQNQAIDKMNKDQLDSKLAFDKKYADLQIKNKTVESQIKKQESYISPINVNECDAAKSVIKDFIKDRDVK